MSDSSTARLAASLQECAHPITATAADYDPLMNLIGDARLVLLGEASHGTHEFYQQRSLITQRLIQEKGFTAVAVEADWPDAYRINRFVRGASEDPTAAEALGNFERFPMWMWRNTDVLDLVTWLRQFNDGLASDRPKVGFYGLDLYSLYGSISAVLQYLDQTDPAAAQRARDRYACFEHFDEDSQNYGYAVSFGLSEPCEQAALSQLLELQRQAAEYIPKDGPFAKEEFFYAEQNARLIKNAEAYYRSMFQGRVSSWNLRDRHMAETIDHLLVHLDQPDQPAKIVVWAHNSHLGNARATEMADQGELNVGQLVRDRYGQEAVLIGFSTYTGTVTAASEWDGPAETKQVRPGMDHSYEAVFHEVGLPQFWLNLRDPHPAIAKLQKARLQRAIGVIYRPESERFSHYFHARLPEQFDAIIHLDETHAVEPLDRQSVKDIHHVPDTYPSSL